MREADKRKAGVSQICEKASFQIVGKELQGKGMLFRDAGERDSRRTNPKTAVLRISGGGRTTRRKKERPPLLETGLAGKKKKEEPEAGLVDGNRLTAPIALLKRMQKEPVIQTRRGGKRAL